ncbi:MAG: hypothetical protein J5I98_04115 [Phaeodactylibacter sp.]|nr:hypothetical protein [Phaeodactylibacter sp.]
MTIIRREDDFYQGRGKESAGGRQWQSAALGASSGSAVFDSCSLGAVSITEQRLSLYSVMGREVLAHGLPEGATSFAFSVADLPPGVYFRRIWEGAAAVWSTRVVVGR